ARRKNIAEHAEQAQVSKRLPTMRRDPALDCDPPAPLLSPPHPPKLKEMFRTFEFRNLLNRVDELDATVPAAELVVEGVSVPWHEGLPVIEGRGGIAAGGDRGGWRSPPRRIAWRSRYRTRSSSPTVRRGSKATSSRTTRRRSAWRPRTTR